MQISEPAEYVILGLLESKSMHGYEMFQQFESGTLGQIVHLEMSQMYAFLKKLERLQYVESQLESQGVRPPRKVSHITPLGHTMFLQWLTEPVERPREIRIVFLLKLYFVQRILPEETAALVEREIEACRTFLSSLESQAQRYASTHTGDAAFFDHVVLRSRIHQTRALLAWLGEL